MIIFDNDIWQKYFRAGSQKSSSLAWSVIIDHTDQLHYFNDVQVLIRLVIEVQFEW